MTEWRESKLGDVITLKRGYDLPQQRRKAGPFPIVSSSGVTDHHIEAKVKGPGVVTGRYGTLGEVFYIQGDFWPLNTSLYVQDFKGNDPRFVSFFLRQLNFGTKNAAGAVPGVNRNHLHAMDVRIPLLPVQRRIAGILSAYDDLIANNQRRIKILEEMARSLHREWFVHLRFPGHDKVKMVPSRLGPIPQGWWMKAVAESFEILGGGTPSRKEPKYWEGGTIQWFAPSDLTGEDTMFMDDSRERITERGLAESSARLFPLGSVMLTSRATIGAIAINTHEASTNQGFITCLPNERVTLYFLFHWLKENVPMFQRIASGATFKEISRGVFKTIDFLQPPAELVRRFESTVTPMAEQALMLQRQIKNLRRTRDLLLPRLLSGQVDLSKGSA
jgi:type I restriction enzyme S subunit